MILQLASRHCKKIAGFYLFVFYLSIVLPLGARSMPVSRTNYYGGSGFVPKKANFPAAPHRVVKQASNDVNSGVTNKKVAHAIKAAFIGGPSQPEMSSFKSVSADKLVNLFTGDFSYNIPLLDVGGYPINIYYDGGVSPEQEASWVGLGWNINPGNINRNMRGIPDDFSGEEKLTVEQRMKPNRTWGASIGGDGELFGIKLPMTVDLGASFNNHLGPSLDVAVRGSATLFKLTAYSGSEKTSASLGIKLNYGIDINSRAGTSFEGGLSLSAQGNYNHNHLEGQVGASTGYNSRSGMKALTISEQVKFNNTNEYKNKGYQSALERGAMAKFSTSITFAKPSYTPFIRMPVTNTQWSARVQVGWGGYGAATDVEAEVYEQSSEIAQDDYIQKKPMVGYLYYENSENHPDYVMDFTRFNDREVTPTTPIISVPQYTYDVFAIQGEGTGGNIRAYRNDFGYVRDNLTTSKDKNVTGGGDADLWGHYGANLQIINTPSTTGEWKNGNKLRGVTGFTKPKTAFGNAYFRNPGEATVSPLGRYDNIGGTQLARYTLGGSGQSPTIEPELQFFSADGRPVRGTGLPSSVKLTGTNASYKPGNSRSQVINFLSAEEASVIGLDHDIKNYDNVDFLNAGTNTLKYVSLSRVDESGVGRRKHHISQINVTESDGKRYIYGIPVYNTIQKDLAFSVDNNDPNLPDKVAIQSDWPTTGSGLLSSGSEATVDGYVHITTTPAYAHSFLLSGILSPDYVDVTGNGITEDDLGTAVKFNYSKIKDGNDSAYKWRTPHSAGLTGNFNAGNRSEKKDDKAMISYGERESWYLQSVESKNMIALFFVKNRVDGKGAVNEYGYVNNNSNILKALDKISLYSKADLVKNGLNNAKPIKTVHFDYSYDLCQGTPDNPGTTDNKGKLTLTGIYFTYNGKENRKVKSKYSFAYGNNPIYSVTPAADRWGTYKPDAQNPAGLKNSDYPYSNQNKTMADGNAGAWALSTIKLPSGGQIDVTYESDDYAYVQNKRAAVMMNVAGFANVPDFQKATTRLYPNDGSENDYVFIQVPQICQNAGDVKNLYLDGMKQLAFKIWVGMPKGAEYIPCYANFGDQANTDYGVDATHSNIIWVKMQRLGGKSPVSMTTLEYLRQQLPGQAFKGYDVSGETALKQVGDMLLGMVRSLRDAFTDPVNAFRKDNKAQVADLSKCFVRLNAPKGYKYGGGYRVRSVVLRDNWSTMTGQYTASYGQQYNYETTETFNGVTRTISSGVASYEPSIGGEENPWQAIVSVEDALPMGPTSYGAVEMPVLDAFFPAPGVGYSKVTVTSIHAGSNTPKSRSGIGRQVTEFYTAKDYPVSCGYTPFDENGQKEFHQNSTSSPFSKYGYDYKAQSQGFLVATNDMHGKMKSQTSYAEGDLDTKVSYTENFYRNTGVNGLNEQFTFIDSYNNTTFSGNMGVDIELMTDTREFSVKGTSRDHQANLDLFFLLAATIPIPSYWQINGTTENIYRAVTATKVVNYHAVLDRVVVINNGSQVETQNMAYDAETGQVLVTRTNNEFNMPVYNTTYPAYWAYSGMGPANKNIDATYRGINFVNGRIMNDPGIPFESGDELYIFEPNNPVSCPAPSAADTRLIWVYDKNKESSSITSGVRDLEFMDANGLLYNRSGVNFRIVRSGHRNMLEQPIAAITSMDNPIASGTLSFANASRVIDASAVEYREKWQTENDLFKRYTEVLNPNICAYEMIEDPNGTLEQNVNPYRKGLLGNFHSWRSMVFYDGRKAEALGNKTNLPENGFLLNFKPYWIKQPGYMLPDVQNKQWVWNSKLNRVNIKGLELETMDPLGIYTSAQYGYNKAIPVAMANNSRSNEMFAEGFEDYDYQESIYKVQFNSQAKRHIDFYGLSNSNIVSRDATGVTPHSGKYMLQVNNGGTVTKHVNLQAAAVEDYSLPFAREKGKQLVERGTNGALAWAYPDNLFSTSGIIQCYGESGMNLSLYPYLSVPNEEGYGYAYDVNQYIEITEQGTYNFYTDAQRNYPSAPTDPIGYNNMMSVYFYSVTNNKNIYPTLVNQVTIPESFYIRYDYNVCLPKGIYQIIGSVSANYTDNVIYQTQLPSDHYTFQFYGALPGYKSISTQNTCEYDLPIPASESMYHTGFSLPLNKRMLLSAWVKETCGDAANGIPCKENTYTHSQVQVIFPNNVAQNVVMNPAGPIIDGWQRVQGEFTTPVGFDDMMLNFVNSNGSSPVYFDDVRIHPFNANMKSYIYDPVNLRLAAELDPNNYATFYEYDEEGTLIRKKAETREGIKTITETRSALQTSVK